MHIQKTKNIRNGKYVVQVYSFIIFKKDNCLKQKVIYLGYNQVELKYTINEGWDKWEDIRDVLHALWIIKQCKNINCYHWFHVAF